MPDEIDGEDFVSLTLSVSGPPSVVTEFMRDLFKFAEDIGRERPLLDSDVS